MQNLDLHYSVEWRTWLWKPPTAWALGDSQRFRDKRVLELGCRFGKMSCYFASLGALVDGVDIYESHVEIARAESRKWGLSGRTNFSTYSGNLDELAGGYDFVFAKSVVVLLGGPSETGRKISSLLKPKGEYIGVENLAGGHALRLARKYIHRNWSGYQQKFAGMDKATVSELTASFQQKESRTYYDLVVAIRGKHPQLHG